MRALLAAGLIAAAACSPSSGAAAEPMIALVVPPQDPSAAYVEVTGVPARELDLLARQTPGRDEWTRLLRVTVKGAAAAGQPAVAGRYSIERGSLRFAPLFPFDPGREYEVTLDRARLPAAAAAGGATTSPLVATVARPGSGAVPSTTVTQVYPSGDVLLENQLRMYIHFSAPMGLRGGLDYVSLLDEHGKPVEDPFLPLDAGFWNEDRTRYTLFFDPGRQKRGILPNRTMGPSLHEGRTYTLLVRRDWPDANGQPLKEDFTRRFGVGPPDLRPLDQRTWQVTAPAPGTRDPLVVRFPEPLDRGLLLRALGVRRSGAGVRGAPAVESGETRWTFTPDAAWQPGSYELVALTVLEDRAGNRIGRAFEVRAFAGRESAPEAESVVVPFEVAARRD
jgi:hypothetical protein